MDGQPSRSYTNIAIAIIVAALIVGTSIVASSYVRTSPTATITSTFTTTSTTTQTSIISPISSPAELVSVIGPIPPYNPGGPVVSVTLKNGGKASITSLDATLGAGNLENAVNGYSFVFNVSSSEPLQPGQSTQDTRTLIGAGFDTGVDYPLSINGTLVNGTQFSYTVQVQVVPPATTTTTSTSTGSTSTGTVIVPQGTTYQVQSSYDCVAGHVAQPFNVTASSNLEGAISTGQPGVTIYVSNAQDVQDLNMGHPSLWVYTSGLTNSTSFKFLLVPGSYVIWIEGADLGCGASTVTPLEQLTTVTVTQTILLIPD